MNHDGFLCWFGAICALAQGSSHYYQCITVENLFKDFAHNVVGHRLLIPLSDWIRLKLVVFDITFSAVSIVDSPQGLLYVS